ncbi:MAG TPA: alpha/beta fold hydrolase [Burkholderiales bacterium]|nr:alpha/beta fold hydrolase [Burkholderiales bacterium]
MNDIAGPVSAEAMERYCTRVQRESWRALWDAALFDLPSAARLPRPPMLVLGAGRDALVPPEMARLCAQTLRAPYETFPAMGHSMMLDAGWEQVADRIIGWLAGTDAARAAG